MDAFKGWLDTVSTSLTQKPPEETPSVLAEWNSYVKKSHGSDDGAEDLESATVATTSGMSSTTIPFLRFDTISSHLREAPTSFLGAMSRMQSGVQSGVQGAAATATAGVQSLPSRQKLIYFGFFNLAEGIDTVQKGRACTSPMLAKERRPLLAVRCHMGATLLGAGRARYRSRSVFGTGLRLGGGEGLRHGYRFAGGNGHPPSVEIGCACRGDGLYDETLGFGGGMRPHGAATGNFDRDRSLTRPDP
eukprot:jgi/Mesvir1/5489/Mv15535-RA.1